MRYLLDTHTLLWFLEGNQFMPNTVRKKIANPSNECFVSIASLWEITIKLKLKKLHLQFDFKELLSFLDENDIELLPLTFSHLLSLQATTSFHRDPFDNILIARAISEDMTVITKDSNFSLYPVKLSGHRPGHYFTYTHQNNGHGTLNTAQFPIPNPQFPIPNPQPTNSQFPIPNH